MPLKVNSYLSLGSNVGDRAGFLIKAIQKLDDHDKISLIQASKVYETEHWPQSENRNSYLNQVIEIKTSFNPFELLSFTKKIEKDLGRQAKGDLSPRTIDIDILLYGDQVIQSDELIIPHQHMDDRKFVLIPLLGISPNLKSPIHSLAYEEILKNCKNDTKIELYSD